MLSLLTTKITKLTSVRWNITMVKNYQQQKLMYNTSSILSMMSRLVRESCDFTRSNCLIYIKNREMW